MIGLKKGKIIDIGVSLKAAQQGQMQPETVSKFPQHQTDADRAVWLKQKVKDASQAREKSLCAHLEDTTDAQLQRTYEDDDKSFFVWKKAHEEYEGCKDWWLKSIAAPEKVVVVKAPPGAGKTHGIKEILKVCDKNKWRVVVVTVERSNSKGLFLDLTEQRHKQQLDIYFCLDFNERTPEHEYYDVVIIDEAQDLNPAVSEHELLMKRARLARKKLILLGDSFQVLHSGAKSGLDEFSDGSSFTIVLEKTRRVPHSIVREARKVQPNSRMEQVSEELELFITEEQMFRNLREGDLVVTASSSASASLIFKIARHHAVALATNQERVGVLRAIVQNIHARMLNSNCALDDAVQSVLSNKNFMEPLLGSRYDREFRDIVDWVTSALVEADEVETVQMKLTVDPRKENSVTVGSVAETKGDSALRVFIFHPDHIVDSAGTVELARNFLFVAITRSLRDLHYVYKDEKSFPRDSDINQHFVALESSRQSALKSMNKVVEESTSDKDEETEPSQPAGKGPDVLGAIVKASEYASPSRPWSVGKSFFALVVSATFEFMTKSRQGATLALSSNSTVEVCEAEAKKWLFILIKENEYGIQNPNAISRPWLYCTNRGNLKVSDASSSWSLEGMDNKTQVYKFKQHDAVLTLELDQKQNRLTLPLPL